MLRFLGNLLAKLTALFTDQSWQIAGGIVHDRFGVLQVADLLRERVPEFVKVCARR